MKHKAWSYISDLLSWLKNNLKSLSVILVVIFFIGFIVFLTIDFFKYNSTTHNPIQYLIHSFYNNNNDSTSINNIYIKQIDTLKCDSSRSDTVYILSNNIPSGELSSNNIYGHASNILDTTSNLLTYLTLFFAVIGIIVSVALYKYVTIVNILKQETEKLKNKTLDAGLVTLSAVPLVEATQITSDEYNLAIETIRNSIIENGENIKKNPIYSKLLIVESLYYWNKGDYDCAINVLEDACKLTHQGNINSETSETIHYHLARVFKQKYSKNKKVEYKEEALKWAGLTFEPHGKVIKMSLFLIDNDNNGLKEFIINHFEKNSIDEIITAYADDDDGLDIDNIASMTAMPIILIKKNDFNVTCDTRILNKCKRKLLNLYESEIHNWKGANVKASWYRTMHIFSHGATRDNKYKYLFDTYKKKAKNNGAKYLLDCYTLAEDNLENIKIN